MDASLKKDLILDKVGDLLIEQNLSSLATEYNGQSYTSLVAFAATDDLSTIVFATNKSTRKYANITANPQVSMLIDNRCNTEEDFINAMAVTASGHAMEIVGEEWDRLKNIYLEKHPLLKDFIEKQSTALIKVKVENYVLVEGFDRVSSIEF